MNSYFLRLGLALLGVVAFIVMAIVLQNAAGISFKTTYRVCCAIACLVFIAKIGRDYPGERWPLIAFFVALIFNLGLFFSPLTHFPTSKGDMLLFGVPDAAILLAARTVSYPVTDDHHRAVRQQMVLGLIIASIICAGIFALMLFPQASVH